MKLPAQYKLRWDPNYPGMDNCETAFLGEIDIGSIVKMSDGSGWNYSVRGVSTKFVTKGHGKVKTRESARRSVERAWRTWLDFAGLI